MSSAYGPGKKQIYDYVHILAEHVHSQQYVYPTLADAVSLTTAAGDWAQGTLTEIVPASTITSPFDIHEIIVETVNTADKTYQLDLYHGASDTFAGSVRFRADSVRGGSGSLTIMTPIIPANDKLTAKLSIQDGGSKTASISVRYHTY